MKKSTIFLLVLETTLITNIPHAVRDVYSKEILYAATPNLRFAQFAKRRDDLSQQPGGSVKFTKFNNLTKGGKLTEGTPISPKTMGTSEVSITVDEYGNGVKMSEKAIQLSMHDVLGEAAKLLAKDLGVVLDEELRDSALDTANFVTGGAHADPADIEDTDVFTTTVIKDAVEALSGNNAPRFGGQHYICIASPHQLRQLRDDDDWLAVHQYVGVEEVYKGEVGMFEGVRFIETTQMPALTAEEAEAKYGCLVPVWEATIFGENAFAWAVSLEVEMRDNGIEDYGRIHGLAWYAIWGFGLIEEENIFTLITA